MGDRLPPESDVPALQARLYDVFAGLVPANERSPVREASCKAAAVLTQRAMEAYVLRRRMSEALPSTLRKELLAVRDAREGAQIDAIDRMSLEARRLLNQQLATMRADLPEGAGPGTNRSALIAAPIRAGKAAEAAAYALPNRYANSEAKYLAVVVAQAMREAGFKPSAYRGSESGSGKLREGKYATVLRFVLQGVGIPVKEVRRYIQDGLGLLNDPEMEGEFPP